ncbi:head GIN domain-containing protein [Parachitinimonas caeni]|uniref:DUF2807 domain-containing protein n=1 Tax=Parachitinimonas caeni TaxID=3031301 RepID=A0ABT7DYD4_9NEIS|nr:head GIN domain-containing protein [Parachitinimonas caeni]MDK2125068.1 DUF2807 domain-containing protein [Parachitinimonas caeni]
MHKQLFGLIAAALAVGGCDINVQKSEADGKVNITIGSDKGDSEVKQEKRQLAEFDSIESKGPVDVTVEIGDAQSVIVEGNPKYLSQITTEVNGKTLKVGLEGVVVNSRNNLVVRVVMPRLNALSHLGSGDVLLKGLKGDLLAVNTTGSGDITLAGQLKQLNVEMTGSGDLDGKGLALAGVMANLRGSGSMELGALDAEKAEYELLGSGDITTVGKTKQLKINLQGSGTVDAGGLQADSANLSLTGSGDIQAAVKNSVEARSTGSGEISIAGNPAERKTSGKGINFEG